MNIYCALVFHLTKRCMEITAPTITLAVYLQMASKKQNGYISVLGLIFQDGRYMHDATRSTLSH